MRRLVAFVMLAASAALAAAAQEPTQSDIATAAQRQQAVTELARLLRARYCTAEGAEKAAALVERRLRDGAYDALADDQAFADAVTADLRAATSDRHLRFGVAPRPEPTAAAAAPAPPADPGAERATWLANVRRGNYGLPRAEVLPGNVGLLEVRRFQPPDLAGDTVVAAIGFLANVDAVIVDVRNARGGSAHMMPLFAGYFLEKPTSLFDMEFRGDDFTERFWTLAYLPGKRLAQVPMYIVTSAYTFSGAEGFAYRFQVLKRATIVGETTGGGANAGGVLDVAPSFHVFMPMGRPVDRDTGGNWEGVGVVPDVPAAARDAAAVAHVEALKALLAGATTDGDRARVGWAMERAQARLHPVSPTAADLERLAGSYGPYRVWVEGGQLRSQRADEAPFLLVPLSASVFASETNDPVRLEFLASRDGRPASLRFTDGDGRSEEAARLD